MPILIVDGNMLLSKPQDQQGFWGAPAVVYHYFLGSLSCLLLTFTTGTVGDIIMSFQDVGTRPSGARSEHSPGWGKSYSSITSNGSSTSNGAAQPPSGGDTIRDLFGQYQQNVTIFEGLCKFLGTSRDSSELRSQLKAQESVVQVSPNLTITK